MAEMIELKEQEERVILVAVSTGEDDDTAASVDELKELCLLYTSDAADENVRV